MYIAEDNERIMNVGIGGLLFLVIAVLIKFKATLLSVFDTILQDLFTNLDFKPVILNHVMSVLFNPVVCVLYAIVLWFLLWGFKHKMIATWIVCVYISGEIFFLIVRTIIGREQPSGHPNTVHGSFPNHHVYLASMLAMLIFISVVPFIESRWKKILVTVMMWILVILVMLARIQLKAAYPFDTLGALLLSYFWVELWEMIYLSQFENLCTQRIFRNSDYN